MRQLRIQPLWAIFCCATSALFAETKVWNAAAKTRGYWDDPAKWTPVVVRHLRDHSRAELAELYPGVTFSAAAGNNLTTAEGSVVLFEAVSPGLFFVVR